MTNNEPMTEDETTDTINAIVRASIFAADNAIIDIAMSGRSATNAELTRIGIEAFLRNALHNDLIRISPNLEARLDEWLCLKNCGEDHVR